MTTVTSLKATLVAGAALGALATAAMPALAADLIEPTIIEAPVIEEVKPFGGWYLRADVGYSFNEYQDDDLFPGGGFKHKNAVGGGQPAIPIAPTVDAGDTVFVGVGVGGHLGQYLRADLTADYHFNGDLTGKVDRDVLLPGCGTSLGAEFCEAGYAADMEAITVMANAYVDFGTYAGITPYVGAGIGFAHVDYGDVVETSCDNVVNPLPTDKPCPASTAGTGIDTGETFEGDSSLRLAWSLAAGASYDVNHALSIDGGYRFTRIAEGVVSHEADIKDQGLDMHQIRIGARVKLH